MEHFPLASGPHQTTPNQLLLIMISYIFLIHKRVWHTRHSFMSKVSCVFKSSRICSGYAWTTFIVNIHTMLYNTTKRVQHWIQKQQVFFYNSVSWRGCTLTTEILGLLMQPMLRNPVIYNPSCYYKTPIYNYFSITNIFY